MKTLKTLALVGALAAGSSAMATPINGSIGFGLDPITGSVTETGGTGSPIDLTTVTSVQINNPVVTSATGDLTGAGSVTFMSPIGVNGNAPSLIGSQLWSVVIGGTTFTFKVDAAVQDQTLSNSLHFSGYGLMSDGPGGFDDTTGEFQLHIGRSGVSFGFDSTAASVPDGGATAMLLGVGLLGVGALRRKVS